MGVNAGDDRSASERSVIGLMRPLIQERNHVVAGDENHKHTIYSLEVYCVCV